MKRKEVPKHQDRKKSLHQPVKIADPERWKYYIGLAIILMITCIDYFPSLHNGFVWDDVAYIQNNPLITSINLKEIFSHRLGGNYLPLTVLTLATEYHFFQLNETGYHAVNLLIHLLNVILVFYTVRCLSDKVEIALVASLLFGIHPMHVESVAWATELKDMLCCFFFLSSYICYLKYLDKQKRKYYFIALLLFLTALLSKVMAISLPVVLILTDYFKERKLNSKALFEKIPFFLLSLVFGLVAVALQKSSGAVQEIAIFTFPQRVVFACYGFVSYLYKFLVPLNLCAFYPYPQKINGGIPFQYYIYVLLFLGIAASVFYSVRYSKKILFGMGFFTITVFIVLQLLPIGGAILADRYSYIPSVGIFYLAGVGFSLLWNTKLKWMALTLLSGFTLFFSLTTYARCAVWKSGMTLWNDMLSKYNDVPFAYNNRGILYMNDEKYDEALNDFNKAIELKPDYAMSYYNRGVIYYNESRFSEAANEDSKAIALQPDYADAYYNRGLAEYFSGNKEAACKDVRQSVQLGFQAPASALHQICD